MRTYTGPRLRCHAHVLVEDTDKNRYGLIRLARFTGSITGM
ncbi:MAG: hypothetical protein [Olavius algarvensis Delta 4 endosymbiont]|nr:MAG: hypothetical protein [Olavius algarvensis Delta 4 endosymbiont]